MNIFFTSTNPFRAGSMLPDKLCVKMILEYAQLLCTSVRLAGIDDEKLYKATHKNHPSAVWCRQTKANYVWVWNAAKEMCAEYTRRYGKTHKTEAVIDHVIQYLDVIPSGDFSHPPQCMPDEFKHEDTPTAYRRYMTSKPYFENGFRKGRDYTADYLI